LRQEVPAVDGFAGESVGFGGHGLPGVGFVDWEVGVWILGLIEGFRAGFGIIEPDCWGVFVLFLEVYFVGLDEGGVPDPIVGYRRGCVWIWSCISVPPSVAFFDEPDVEV